MPKQLTTSFTMTVPAEISAAILFHSGCAALARSTTPRTYASVEQLKLRRTLPVAGLTEITWRVSSWTSGDISGPVYSSFANWRAWPSWHFCGSLRHTPSVFDGDQIQAAGWRSSSCRRAVPFF